MGISPVWKFVIIQMISSINSGGILQVKFYNFIVFSKRIRHFAPREFSFWVGHSDFHLMIIFFYYTELKQLNYIDQSSKFCQYVASFRKLRHMLRYHNYFFAFKIKTKDPKMKEGHFYDGLRDCCPLDFSAVLFKWWIIYREYTAQCLIIIIVANIG